jgi:hypothetical protein
VWGNTDNDSDAEFALVLLGVHGVTADDFLFNGVSGASGGPLGGLGGGSSSGALANNDYMFV